MENKVSDWIIAQFEKIALSCKELHALLNDDLEHFGKNDLQALGQSNTKKTELMTQLITLVDDLKQEIRLSDADSSGLFDKAVNKLEIESEKNQLTTIMHEIKSEINHCSNFILTNGQVFSRSLKHLKNMWDLALSMNKTETGVYDHTGKVR